ncbi:MAG: hypothetical protein E7369_04735 [Clostridiales bacterium]|nr:hypothetical protein [Clostridiales bacterium]
MKPPRIALFDSGVGGLSLLNYLNQNLSGVTFLYYGDNANSPYGNKTKADIFSLAFDRLLYLSTFNPSVVIFACNTLSLTTLNEMSKLFDFPILGVFPPVESLMKNDCRTVLLSTQRTSEFYSSVSGLEVHPLLTLAGDIENNALSLSKICLTKHLKYIKEGMDNLILGCTHYLLLKNEIVDHLKPRKVYDGASNTLNMLAKYLQNLKTPVNHLENQIYFIGNSASFNKKIWFSVVKNIKI